MAFCNGSMIDPARTTITFSQSRVVEELSNSRSVIRPDYIERATGTNSANELAIKDLADVSAMEAIRG
jgi:hypothetical protein